MFFTDMFFNAGLHCCSITRIQQEPSFVRGGVILIYPHQYRYDLMRITSFRDESEALCLRVQHVLTAVAFYVFSAFCIHYALPRIICSSKTMSNLWQAGALL